MQQETINKSIIRDFYRRAVGQGDIAFADEIIADNYKQHSPMLKPGKAGLLEALTFMTQMPKPASTAAPFLRLIAEGDYVVTNMRFSWGNKQKVVIDLFRFQDGKVAEHWDAVQDEPDETLNGHAMMDGALPIENAGLTDRNKQHVADFYVHVIVHRKFETLPDFVNPALVQHNPDIANGIDGLRTYLQQNADHYVVDNRQRIIGEGDFVVVQAEGKFEKRPATFYDVFRLDEGKIVEQWSVKQVATAT